VPRRVPRIFTVVIAAAALGGCGSTGGDSSDKKPATVACGQTAGGFIKKLTATGTVCSVARRIANDWLDRAKTVRSPEGESKIGIWACSTALKGETATVSCRTGSGDTATFTASP
jgi:hypothetical protein